MNVLFPTSRATRPPGHAWTAFALVGLGRNLVEQERHPEAEELLREAVTTRREAHPDHWLLYESVGLLGAALSGQQRFDAAEPLLLEAVGSDTLPTRGRINYRDEALGYLVAMYRAMGRHDDAERWDAQR